MPAGRIVMVPRKSGLSKKKITKLIDSRINKKSEIKVRENDAAVLVDGSAEITLGTPFEILDGFNGSSGDLMMVPAQDGAGDDEEGSRVGDTIELLGLKLRMINHTSDTNCRLLVVYFPNDNGSGFVSVLGPDVDFLPRKEDFPATYRVLIDKYVRFKEGQEANKLIVLNPKVKGLKIRYSTSAGTAITSGNIRMYILTSTAANGGAVGDFRGAGKLLFRD